MKTFRIILVHAVILVFISFMSFASLYVYKTNPKVHDLMHEMNSDITWELLLKSSFFMLGNLLLGIYSFYFILFKQVFKKKLSVKSVLFSLGVIVLLVCIRIFTDEGDVKLSSIPGSVLWILFFGGLGLGARAIIEYFNEKDKQKELEKKNLQSELNLLRSQINPHFLFNTLNNIDALVRKNPERASELLIKLSVQMRYMLYDSNTEKISLGSEIEFIKDYISLQKLRIRNQKTVKFSINGEFKDKLITPMLFIPFIENAFKHCSDKEHEGAIEINIAENKDQLSFFTSNSYDPDKTGIKDKSGGIGLDLVKRRLKLIYPDRHFLEITSENSRFTVRLNIQLDGN